MLMVASIITTATVEKRVVDVVGCMVHGVAGGESCERRQ